MQQNHFLLLTKIQKYLKCPALAPKLTRHNRRHVTMYNVFSRRRPNQPGRRNPLKYKLQVLIKYIVLLSNKYSSKY